MSKKYYLLLLLPLLGMAKCKKEPVPAFSLPPASQVGANTLGFMVHGRVWQNYGVRCTFYGCDTNKVASSFHKSGMYFTLRAGQNARDVDESFGIVLDSIVGTGTYRTISPRRAQRQLQFSERTAKQEYSTARPGSSTFVITRLDTARHILSGTFEGVLQSTTLGSTESVSITDGRFDVKYE